MGKVITTDSGTLFAALKLIEQLYRDGKITEIVYKNIIEEYASHIDTSAFDCYNKP